MTAITPRTLSRAFCANENTSNRDVCIIKNMVSEAGDYPASTRTMIIGFLTLGIGFLVFHLHKYFSGTAEDKKREFVNLLPQIHNALSAIEPGDHNKEIGPIKLDDDTTVTFTETTEAGIQNIHIKFFSAQSAKPLETRVVEGLSFEKLRHKINDDVHINKEQYQAYLSSDNPEHEAFLATCEEQYQEHKKIEQDNGRKMLENYAPGSLGLLQVKRKYGNLRDTKTTTDIDNANEEMDAARDDEF